MKVVITSSDKNLEARLDPRFGKCRYFIIIDTDTMDFEVVDNQNNALGGGAGVKAAQQLAARKVGAVITGKCGPKAVQAFSDAGIDVFTGQKGKVKGVVDAYQNGQLLAQTKSNLGLDTAMCGHQHRQGQCSCQQHNQQSGIGAGNESN